MTAPHRFAGLVFVASLSAVVLDGCGSDESPSTRLGSGGTLGSGGSNLGGSTVVEPPSEGGAGGERPYDPLCGVVACVPDEGAADCEPIPAATGGTRATGGTGGDGSAGTSATGGSLNTGGTTSGQSGNAGGSGLNGSAGSAGSAAASSGAGGVAASGGGSLPAAGEGGEGGVPAPGAGGEGGVSPGGSEGGVGGEGPGGSGAGGESAGGQAGEPPGGAGQAQSGGSSAGGTGATSFVTQSCQVGLRSNGSVRASCAPAGRGQASDGCFSGADCAPGLACVGDSSPGQCRPFCCAGDDACADHAGTHCTEERLVGASSRPRVPVCMPAVECSLAEEYPCPAGASCTCPERTACMVVLDDGTTSCVPESRLPPDGQGKVDMPCPCAFGHICSEATNRCLELCQTAAAPAVECTVGRCQAWPDLPSGWGVCVGTTSNAR